MFASTYDYVFLSSTCAHLRPYLNQEAKVCVLQSFEDGEAQVTIPPMEEGASVLYLTSMAGQGRPAHDHLVEACLTLRAIRQAGAACITAGLVYGAYTRQSDNGALMYNLLTASGADRIWVMEPHVLAMPPVQTVTVIPMFAEDIRKRFARQDPLIVSPDQGGASRATMVAELTQSDVCVLHKQRSGEHIDIQGMEGGFPKGRICLIVDDLMQSGQTLLAAVDYLKQQGAGEIHAYVTHNLAHPDTAHMLLETLASISTSNSIYHEALPRLRVILLPLV